KLLDEGQGGDNVGCLIRGIEREEVERGQVLAKTGSVKPHTKFTAQVYVLTKEEGGRHTPFYNGYRPQFYLRTTDVTGAIGLPDGAEMIMPGDNVEMSVELITPIAIEIGQRFAIREGGRTVGAGAIVSIVEKRDGKSRSPSHARARLHRVQGADVHDAQEQEERSEQARTQQILSARPPTYTSPRGEVVADRRGVAQLAEHWSPKPAVVGSSPIAPATHSTSVA